MKKIFILMFSIFIVTMYTNTVQAANAIKNYYAYTIIGKKMPEIIENVDAAVQGEKGVVKISKSPNTYFFTYNDEHYYMRFYLANNNTDVYIVADTSYDKDNNTLTNFFKQHNLRYRALEDKAALTEYKFDFIDCARTGVLNGLFIMPDYIKPLKTGMGKINDKISKNSKKTSAIPYSNDTETIDLPLINTEIYTNEEAQVNVTVKEYRLKNKENKYVHAFAYTIRNDASTNITIDKVTSERLASMKDITTQTFVDLDRLDLIDTVAGFPPVVICTCGLSLIGSVPNWVRLAKVTKESIKFAHTLPENYKLAGNSQMKILVLKFKNDPKPLNFTVTREGETYKFSY